MSSAVRRPHGLGPTLGDIQRRPIPIMPIVSLHSEEISRLRRQLRVVVVSSALLILGLAFVIWRQQQQIELLTLHVARTSVALALTLSATEVLALESRLAPGLTSGLASLAQEALSEDLPVEGGVNQ